MHRFLFGSFSVFFILILFGVTGENALAAGTTEVDTTVIADVYLSGVKTEQPRPGTFAISFNIVNDGVALGSLKVRVDLTKTVDGFVLVKDSWIDDGVFGSASGTISKTVEYTASGFLSGDYKLMVSLYDVNGMLYATNSAGMVALKGSGQYISIKPDQCYLTVNTDTTDTHYLPSVGVDVSADEVLTGHCPLQNLSDRDLDARIVLATFYRSLIGENVQPESALSDAILLSAGETKDLSFVIPTVKDPQAYSTRMYLSDQSNERISDEAEFHYVMRGVSATIQRASYSVINPSTVASSTSDTASDTPSDAAPVDASVTGSGDVVDVSFTWTPSADSHIQRRVKQEYSNEYYAQLAWKSPTGTVYAVGEKMRIGIDGFGVGPTHALIGLPKGFENPTLSLSITDGTGRILGEQTFKESAKDRAVVGAPAVIPSDGETTGNGSDSIRTIAFEVFGALTIILFGVILVWRRRSTSLLALLVVGSAILFGGVHQAEAKTIVHRDSATVDHYFEVTANFNLEKRPPDYYVAGETMVFYYSLTDAVCNDGVHTGSTLKIDIFGDSPSPDFISSGVWGGNYEARIPIPSDQAPGMYSAHACVNIGVWEGATYACTDIEFEVKKNTFKLCSNGSELSQLSLAPSESRDLRTRFGVGSGCSDSADADVSSSTTFTQSISDGAANDAVSMTFSPPVSIQASQYVSPLFDATGQQTASEIIKASYNGGTSGAYSKSLTAKVIEFCRNLCVDNAAAYCVNEVEFSVADSCGILQNCGPTGTRNCSLNWKESIPGEI